MVNALLSNRSSREEAQESLGIGDTWLKVKTINGCPHLVDQDGKIVNGIKAVSVSSEVNELVLGSCTFISKADDDV